MVGYRHLSLTDYEEKYKNKQYYWGITPNNMCYEIMKLRPPVKPYRVLDIGCGGIPHKHCMDILIAEKMV